MRHFAVPGAFPYTVDGRKPEIAPPKKPRSDDSPVNTNKRYVFNRGFFGGAISGIRPSTVSVATPVYE